jgi:lipoyl(octanoyl) transferase
MEIKISKKPIDYKKAMLSLDKRVDEVYMNKNQELLWLLKHPNLYTGGISAPDNELIDKNKFPVFKTNRGGKWTFHGDGQKVVYFVMNLNKRDKAIRGFVNKIEDTIISTLNELDIESFKDKNNIGIWVKQNNLEQKIAAIGIKVKKWIAYHGFSININNKLDKYDSIIPCGISNRGVTNLKTIVDQNYDELENKLIENFLINLKS